MDDQKTRNTYRMMGVKTLHLLLTVGLFYGAWLLFRYHGLTGMSRYGFRYNYYITLAYGVLYYWFCRAYNAYLFGYTRIRSLAFGQLLSQLFSVVIIYSVVSIGWKRFNSPWPFVPMLGLQFAVDCVWSYFANGLYCKLNPRKRTLLIYRNGLDKMRFGSIRGKPMERLYGIVDELQYDGSFRELRERLEGYEAVFVAGVNSRCRNGILKYCKENNIPGLFLPHVGDTIMQEAVHIQSFDAPVLYVNRKELHPEYAIVKRVFDIVSSAAALLLLSPIMLAAGLIIHLYDGGPVFYRQTRLTKDGKEFEILKFRSMREDAEKDGVARLSTGENDERITPVGRIIRRLRIDELPQLWNILVGDLSVVGPRPERPELAERYGRTIPEFKLRLQVKAGLTGYAQVYGKYNTDPYEKLEFDLLYINHMNILTDLKICFATLAILFSKESTEGVKTGQTTAMGYEGWETHTADQTEAAVR